MWKAGGQIGQVSRKGEWNIQVLGETAFDCNGQQCAAGKEKDLLAERNMEAES